MEDRGGGRGEEVVVLDWREGDLPCTNLCFSGSHRMARVRTSVRQHAFRDNNLFTGIYVIYSSDILSDIKYENVSIK